MQIVSPQVVLDVRRIQLEYFTLTGPQPRMVEGQRAEPGADQPDGPGDPAPGQLQRAGGVDLGRDQAR